MRLADRADNCRFDSLRKVDSQSHGFYLRDHRFSLLRRSVGFHYDHHGISPKLNFQPLLRGNQIGS